MYFSAFVFRSVKMATTVRKYAPRLGERAPPEKRPSIDDDAMASKADVSSAAKPNQAKMQVAPRMPQSAAISATQAPIALTAVASMATGSEGAEVCAGEMAAASGVQQPSEEAWAAMGKRARRNHRQRHNYGARNQGGK